MTEQTLYGYRLRPEQAQHHGLPRWTHGRLGGARQRQDFDAGPARRAPDLEGRIDQECEVLVVTMQNSAVDNIAQRIRRILVESRLPPVGYHVCTLHKLANDILRQRYDLAGVEEGFFIVDEAEAQRSMHSAADVWIAGASRLVAELSAPGKRWAAPRRGRAVARQDGRRWAGSDQAVQAPAPDARASARAMVQAAGDPGDFLPMGLDLYDQYQRYLRARSGLDFDDLIWRAIDALEQDPVLLRNLRMRWPYILEDEAQDSSPLQEQILATLAGEHGQLGARGRSQPGHQQHLHRRRPALFPRFLPAGRCRARRPARIGALWPPDHRPGQPSGALGLRRAPRGRWFARSAFELQDIRPTAPGDAQPNPPDEECHLHFQVQPFADNEAEAEQGGELGRPAMSERYPERTVAMLCPTQWQGANVVKALQKIEPAVVL